MKRKFIVYVVSYVLGTFMFVLFFWTPIAGSSAFFYRGVMFLIIVSLLMTALLYAMKRLIANTWFAYRDIVALVIIWFCGMLVFFTHIPVTADRSVSIFLLGYMNAHESVTHSDQELQAQLVNTYMSGNGALQKRIAEQLELGTITRQGGGYRITPWGELLMRFYAFIADVFHIDKKNLSM